MEDLKVYITRISWVIKSLYWWGQALAQVSYFNKKKTVKPFSLIGSATRRVLESSALHALCFIKNSALERLKESKILS